MLSPRYYDTWAKNLFFIDTHDGFLVSLAMPHHLLSHSSSLSLIQPRYFVEIVVIIIIIILIIILLFARFIREQDINANHKRLWAALMVFSFNQRENVLRSI